MTEQNKIVCVDLDGVLARYTYWKGVENIGTPVQGAQQFVEKLLAMCDKVLLHTTRTNHAVNKDFVPIELIGRVENWLRENKFPDGIKVACDPGKPIASAYVDDRAVICRPKENNPGVAFRNALHATKILLG